jgi:hypothetical protein
MKWVVKRTKTIPGESRILMIVKLTKVEDAVQDNAL